MMHVVIILLPTVYLIISILTDMLFAPTHSSPEQRCQTYTPENTIIVFDLHGVLFKCNIRHLVTHFLTHPASYIFLQHITNPRVWYDAYRLWRKKVIAQEYISYFTQHYPQLMLCQQWLIELCNAQEPIRATMELVEHLKKQGYTLHILSNIGQQIYNHLYDNFTAALSYFDQVKVVTEKEQFIGKPSMDVFINYTEQCNPERKQIIFIDNRLQNIKAAQQVGFIGLHFTKASRLKKQLQQLGVVI